MSSLRRQSRQVSCKHSPKDSLHTDWIRSQRGDTQPAHRHTTGWLPLVVLPPSLMRQTREDRHSKTHVDITRNGFLSTSCKSLQYCKRASFHRIPFPHMWSLRPQSQIWLATYFFSGPINQIQYVYRDFLKGCGLSHFGRKVSGTIRTAIYDNFNKQFISTVYYFFIDQSIRFDFFFFLIGITLFQYGALFHIASVENASTSLPLGQTQKISELRLLQFKPEGSLTSISVNNRGR